MMPRTRSEIAAAAVDLRITAAFGAMHDHRGPVVTQFEAMERVAEALEWAAGADNDFAALLAGLKRLDGGG
jgi:hypothetical protein